METKNRIIILGLIYCCVFLNGVKSFSVSVPPVRSVCRTMTPGHDKIKPQVGEVPFNVSSDVATVKGGQLVDIVLSAKEGKNFKGYYVQARDSNNSPIGTFNSNSLTKTHSCGGIKGNAAHHASPELKQKVKVSWTAPENYKGDVQFLASFVENYVTFWTMVKAPHTVKVTA